MTAWPNGKAYLFRGASYVRLDRATSRVDGVPTPVFGNWRNLPADLSASVTSVWIKTELTAPVGRGGGVTAPNTIDDQRFVARLLDRVPVALGGTGIAGPTLWSLPRDGVCTDDLSGAIVRFQQAQQLPVDGRIDPPATGGVTIGRLVELADSPLPGPIETRLSDLSAQGIDLGPQTSEPTGAPAGLGRLFAAGLLIAIDVAEVVLIRGAAVDTWLESGALDGPLGRPLGDSADLADGTATASPFTGGTLVEDRADGTLHTLPPAVGARYLDAPWDLGMPTGESGPAVGPDSPGTFQAFTGGVAITDPDGAVHLTLRPIFDTWQADPGTALSGLGWPVGDARKEDGTARQMFTGGILTLQADGTVNSAAVSSEAEPAPPLLRYLLPADVDRHLSAATPDNKVDFFLDGAGAFADMARTIRAATGPHDFVYLLGWYCDIDLELVPGQPWSALRSLLASATHDEGDGRGAEVRCILWQAKEKPPTVGPVVWEAARAVSVLKAFGGPPLNFTNYRAVQTINALPNGSAVLDNRTLLAGSHHQKVLVVRAGERLVAYCGGMDLNPDRLHPQGVKGSLAKGAPLQDVHLRIEGPGAFELLRSFSERWHATSEADGPLRGDALVPVSGAVTGPNLVQIAHTYGRGCPFPTAVQTGREVLDNALRSARRYVYMECQYYVGNDHLRSALRAALRTVEVAIVVMAPLDAVDDLPDLAFRRKAFLAPLKADFGDRLLLFQHLGQNRGTATPGAYLHSKLMLVDDEAAFVGTLNYSRRSWSHDSEVMVSVVDSRGPGGLGPLPGFAAALRSGSLGAATGPEHAARPDRRPGSLQNPAS